MTSLKLKTIDFKTQNLGSQSVEVSSDLELNSPKSVAFVVRWQLAKRRSGSAKTKTMAEISGTTAKPYKQKGTGNARQGSKRSVQFVGGRTCHGPTPRSFDFTMPKKVVKVALSDVLKLKLKENKVFLFSDDFGSEIKTSQINSSLKKNNVESALIIYNSSSKNNEVLARSARNLKNVKALNASAINVYDILSFDHLMIDNTIFENIKGAL
ncbi:MAG: 50S ribosomal protein L4 [Pelagibacterales bacterium]|nr:50S ribosomal protein L4 [Pelagibacterales bacterium]